MKKEPIIIIGLALLVTISSILTWQITGGDYYTKFEVVEEVEQPLDPDDPLAGTGFYDNEQSQKQIQIRQEFRFGLLPTPKGLVDKHMFSVASVVPPVWFLVLGYVWWQRRKE